MIPCRWVSETVRTKTKTRTSFVCERSGTFFFSSSSLKTTSLAFFTPHIYVFSRKKLWVAVIMLYMNDTLDEEDVKMIFDELEVQTSPLKISFS